VDRRSKRNEEVEKERRLIQEIPVLPFDVGLAGSGTMDSTVEPITIFVGIWIGLSPKPTPH
jgi:hypothetical protein